ncbi:MAG TPA: hypothetical protein VHU80_10810, partial [Polyangiaceae bacterium]|nr:hypothetical protein [Polyangiaceae bacterium]
SRGKVIAIAVVQGLTLGGATLAAAAWLAGDALPRFGGHHDDVPAASATVAVHRAAQLGVHEPAAPPSDIPTAAFDDVAEASSAEVARSSAGDAASRVKTAPGSARRAPEGRVAANVGDTPRTSADVTPAPSAPVESASASGPWTRVAQALSVSDWTRADEALSELVATSEPSTRDAAALARAELRIAHGAGDSMRSDVERLAQAGATPLVRKRATRLLERMR